MLKDNLNSTPIDVGRTSDINHDISEIEHVDDGSTIGHQSVSAACDLPHSASGQNLLNEKLGNPAPKKSVGPFQFATAKRSQQRNNLKNDKLTANQSGKSFNPTIPTQQILLTDRPVKSGNTKKDTSAHRISVGSSSVKNSQPPRAEPKPRAAPKTKPKVQESTSSPFV